MAILKMLSAILLLPAVQNRIDAMLASGTAAMGSALITGANRFSSGLFVLIDGVIPDEYLPQTQQDVQRTARRPHATNILRAARAAPEAAGQGTVRRPDRARLCAEVRETARL